MRVNTTDLQNAFGKYLALVDKEDIIVVKNGKSVARLSMYTDPEHFLIHEEAKNYKTYRKICYEEYMELVSTSDQRYELINGDIYLLASPSFKHQLVVNEIAFQFHSFFKGKPCRSVTAPLDIRLFGFAAKFEEDPNVVQPDVVVVCDPDNLSEDNRYMGIPSLVVEVLSPSSRGKDMVAKLQLYMRSGIAEYWIVDVENKRVQQFHFNQERDIETHNIFQQGETLISAIFPELQLKTDNIFNIP